MERVITIRLSDDETVWIARDNVYVSITGYGNSPTIALEELRKGIMGFDYMMLTITEE